MGIYFGVTYHIRVDKMVQAALIVHGLVIHRFDYLWVVKWSKVMDSEVKLVY